MESGLLFLGVIVSLFIQWLKKNVGTTSLGTLVALAVVALAAATVVYYLKLYGFYETLLQILATAGAFYAFIIRLFEEDKLAANGFKLVK
jgi:recombinational DNA repair protein (RecF pathway)